MQTQQAPTYHNYKSDLSFVGTLLGIWLIPWFLITWAAKLAGGGPTDSPIKFVDIGSQIKRYQADHGFVWWHFVGAYGQINAVMFWIVLVTILALIIGGISALFMMWTGGIPTVGPLMRWAPTKKLQSNSKWATKRDLRDMKVKAPTPGRMILGIKDRVLIAADWESSVLVVGPTRSGKTTGLIIPTIFDWEGPCVVTSTKSELVKITAGHRQTKGKVFIYDPAEEISSPNGDPSKPYKSITWSPLAGCEDFEAAIRTAGWLSEGLKKGEGKSDNDWEHWANAAKSLMAPMLYLAANTGRTISDIRRWIDIHEIDEPTALLISMMPEDELEYLGRKKINEDPNMAGAEIPVEDLRRIGAQVAQYDITQLREMDENLLPIEPAKAIIKLKSVESRPEKERATVFSTANNIFNLFTEQAIARSAASSLFEPDDFLDNNGTLYLCTPVENPERLAPLYTAILNTIINRAKTKAQKTPKERLDPPLLLALDELANVCPIDELPKIASEGAGRGILIMSIVQDISQLTTRYGESKTNTIFNNHRATVILPGVKDPKTSEYLSKVIGKHMVTSSSLSINEGKVGRSLSNQQQEMVAPDLLRQLPPGHAIVIWAHKSPMVVRLRLWYQSGFYLKLSQKKFYKKVDQVIRKAA